MACWKGPRPGLATLADMYEWAEKGRRGYTSLAGKGWKELIANQAVPADVDALALAHVREFWRPYGLPFPFAKVAHKLEQHGYHASVSRFSKGGTTYYRVRVGPYTDRAAAEKAMAGVAHAYGGKAEVVPNS